MHNCVLWRIYDLVMYTYRYFKSQMLYELLVSKKFYIALTIKQT